ncbi:MAG TPA: hypothetical protein VGF48_22265 [Thermoanaerobaculia bacterium]
MIGAADERALTLRNRVHRWRDAKLIDDAGARAFIERFPTAWRSSGLLAQIVGFGLAAAGVALFAAFWDLLVDSTLIAGVVAIALAEWLIRGKRWWSTGVESALWVGGLFALIFALPGESKPEALLLFMGACIAGVIRLRQPWFGALATIFLFIYLEQKQLEPIALIAGLTIALVALALLHRTWMRPSTEWLLIALLLVAPPCAFFASYNLLPNVVTAAIFGLLALVLLVSGLRMRHHAPLAAAAIAMIFVTAETYDFLPLLDEAKMAIAGAALLLLSAVVSRALRDRTTGLVATPPARSDADDLLDLGSAIVATPQQPPSSAPAGRPEGDGGFGGAGATGDL